jgi:hypothetical protein
VIPLGLIVTVCVVDVLSPPHIHLGPLLVAAPAITVAFAGAGVTAMMGILAVAAQVLIGVLRGVLVTANIQAQVVALVVVSVVCVTGCGTGVSSSCTGCGRWLRQRRVSCCSPCPHAPARCGSPACTCPPQSLWPERRHRLTKDLLHAREQHIGIVRQRRTYVARRAQQPAPPVALLTGCANLVNKASPA